MDKNFQMKTSKTHIYRQGKLTNQFGLTINTSPFTVDTV